MDTADRTASSECNLRLRRSDRPAENLREAVRSEPRADAREHAPRVAVGAKHLRGEPRPRLDERVVRTRERPDREVAALLRRERRQPLRREPRRDDVVERAVEPERGNPQLRDPGDRIDAARPGLLDPRVDLCVAQPLRTVALAGERLVGSFSSAVTAGPENATRKRIAGSRVAARGMIQPAWRRPASPTRAGRPRGARRGTAPRPRRRARAGRSSTRWATRPGTCRPRRRCRACRRRAPRRRCAGGAPVAPGGTRGSSAPEPVTYATAALRPLPGGSRSVRRASRRRCGSGRGSSGARSSGRAGRRSSRPCVEARAAVRGHGVANPEPIENAVPDG